MCEFFSWLSDGKGSFFYVDSKSRKDKQLREKWSNFDSHSTISSFLSLKDDAHNKYEFTLDHGFRIDNLSTNDDSIQAEKWIKWFIKTEEFKEIVKAEICDSPELLFFLFAEELFSGSENDTDEKLKSITSLNWKIRHASYIQKLKKETSEDGEIIVWIDDKMKDLLQEIFKKSPINTNAWKKLHKVGFIDLMSTETLLQIFKKVKDQDCDYLIYYLINTPDSIKTEYFSKKVLKFLPLKVLPYLNKKAQTPYLITEYIRRKFELLDKTMDRKLLFSSEVLTDKHLEMMLLIEPSVITGIDLPRVKRQMFVNYLNFNITRKNMTIIRSEKLFPIFKKFENDPQILSFMKKNLIIFKDFPETLYEDSVLKRIIKDGNFHLEKIKNLLPFFPEEKVKTKEIKNLMIKHKPQFFKYIFEKEDYKDLNATSWKKLSGYFNEIPQDVLNPRVIWIMLKEDPSIIEYLRTPTEKQICFALSKGRSITRTNIKRINKFFIDFCVKNNHLSNLFYFVNRQKGLLQTILNHPDFSLKTVSDLKVFYNHVYVKKDNINLIFEKAPICFLFDSFVDEQLKDFWTEEKLFYVLDKIKNYPKKIIEYIKNSNDLLISIKHFVYDVKPLFSKRNVRLMIEHLPISFFKMIKNLKIEIEEEDLVDLLISRDSVYNTSDFVTKFSEDSLVKLMIAMPGIYSYMLPQQKTQKVVDAIALTEKPIPFILEAIPANLRTKEIEMKMFNDDHTNIKYFSTLPDDNMTKQIAMNCTSHSIESDYKNYINDVFVETIVKNREFYILRALFNAIITHKTYKPDLNFMLNILKEAKQRKFHGLECTAKNLNLLKVYQPQLISAEFILNFFGREIEDHLLILNEKTTIDDIHTVYCIYRNILIPTMKRIKKNLGVKMLQDIVALKPILDLKELEKAKKQTKEELEKRGMCIY